MAMSLQRGCICAELQGAQVCIRATHCLSSRAVTARLLALFGCIPLTPRPPIQGHKDWLFGAAWVTERHLISCSRDKSVKLWQINVDGPSVCSTPLHTSLLHKVNIRYLFSSQRTCCHWMRLQRRQTVANRARVVCARSGSMSVQRPISEHGA